MKYLKTVRCIVFFQDRILMLKKSLDSNNPGAWEFPGGKIEKDLDSEDYLRESAVRELKEETGINIDQSNLHRIANSQKITFEYKGKTKAREIFYFSLILKIKPAVILSSLLNSYGESEDKHDDFDWFTKDEYRKMVGEGTVSQNSIIDLDS